MLTILLKSCGVLFVDLFGVRGKRNYLHITKSSFTDLSDAGGKQTLILYGG